MPQLATYDSYGERFRFEPPVEIGSHIVDSLGRLAAIAACGCDANIVVINEIAESANQTLRFMHTYTGTDGFAEFLSNTASIGMREFEVTIEQSDCR